MCASVSVYVCEKEHFIIPWGKASRSHPSIMIHIHINGYNVEIYVDKNARAITGFIIVIR